MKVRYLGYVIALQTAFAFSAEPATDAAGAAAEAQIRATLAAVTKGYHDRSADAATSLYVNDDQLLLFDLIPPLQQKGFKGVHRSAETLFAGTLGPVTMEYSDVFIVVDGRHAYLRAFCHAAMTMKDNSKVDILQRVTDVFENRSGRWLVILEHASVPIDLKSGLGYLHADKSGPGVPFKSLQGH
jgi:ketosteroid isomerase-like protein